MKIVADENIPLLKECFASVADVVTLPGRAITALDVHDADALLVRSVTEVNDKLLGHSSLKFVATVTAGVEHVDQSLLQQRGVAFYNATGCNATAVSEYVFSALDILAEKYHFQLRERTFGIIGKGQVGSRLVLTLQRLGCNVLVTDPLCKKIVGVAYVSLEELIEQCDVISLHVPLTAVGAFPTQHMISKRHLDAMKTSTVLINTGRGVVIDNTALRECLKSRKDLKVILDVWEHEPAIDADLLSRVDLATPHIAGYSLDGKMAGANMVYQSFCQFFGVPASVDIAEHLPPPTLRLMNFSENATAEEVVSRAIRAVYDIRRDDGWMRQLLEMNYKTATQAFDKMRKNYPVRREFNALTIKLTGCCQPLRAQLIALGFNVLEC